MMASPPPLFGKPLPSLAGRGWGWVCVVSTCTICLTALYADLAYNCVGSHVSVTSTSALSSRAPSWNARQSSADHRVLSCTMFCAFAIGLSVIPISRRPPDRSHSPTLPR
ncbi:MAG: hypothetical protein IJV24_03225 [Prevotella sp.]|nr:hypothetical protein [Prevotella sp.]